MLRLLVPLAILLATFAAAGTATAAPRDPCDTIDCPRPILVVDGERACVGVAGSYGGTAYCWFADRPLCVTRYFWNAYQEVCPLGEPVIDDLVVSDPCAPFTVCPRPILHVGTEGACVGVAFEIGGYAACWNAARPNCVTQHFGFAYRETCVPPEDFWANVSLA